MLLCYKLIENTTKPRKGHLSIETAFLWPRIWHRIKHYQRNLLNVACRAPVKDAQTHGKRLF